MAHCIRTHVKTKQRNRSGYTCACNPSTSKTIDAETGGLLELVGSQESVRDQFQRVR